MHLPRRADHPIRRGEANCVGERCRLRRLGQGQHVLRDEIVAAARIHNPARGQAREGLRLLRSPLLTAAGATGLRGESRVWCSGWLGGG